MPRSTYTTDVFINCPFDPAYNPLYEAIVFSVFDCGYRARCTLEIDDASQVRIETISRIITECKFGIHDLSRTDPDPANRLPRFNMPLELGIFLAAKRFGSRRQREKVCLILDRSKYRYQKFISDISGQDVRSHENRPRAAITVVRNWLRTASARSNIPGGSTINQRFRLFQRDLPRICTRFQLERSELTFNDYAHTVWCWLDENA